MQKAAMVLLAISFLTINLMGCAALFNTGGGKVVFNSNPSGAEVIVDGQPLGTTPVTLELSRTTTHFVTIIKDDVEKTYVLNRELGGEWIFLDILGGLIPVVIDASTGAWYDLTPNYINAQLVSSKPGATMSEGQLEVKPRDSVVQPGKIGIQISYQTVVSIVPAGPADLAGLKVGDKILTANGIPLNGDASYDARLISGAPNTSVTLKILRGDQELEISVVRGQ